MTRRLWSTVFFLGVLATLTWAQVRPIVTPGGGGGGGAPTTATYITQTADIDLSNEQALSALGTGLVFNTTKTGVLSIYGGAAACSAGEFVTAISAAGVTTCAAAGAAGANTALSNLASVAINAALIPGTAGALDLGSTAKPWGALWLAGTSGTPGTNQFTITGASTGGVRTVTLPDAALNLSVTTQNYVLATGAAGAGAPSLRALVTLDLPSALPAASTMATSLTGGNGFSLQTGTTAADTIVLKAYDVDGTAYRNAITLTANNAPTIGINIGATTTGETDLLINPATKANGNLLDLQVGNVSKFYVNSGGGVTTTGGVVSGSDVQVATGRYLFFATNAYASAEAANIIQLGLDANGSAVHQQLKAHDGITGTDIAGANLTLAAGRGTGAGAPGTLIFQTATAVGSGTTAQTLATRLIIGATGAATLGTTAETGAGAFYAGSYFVGTTAGADCTSAAAVTVAKGIVTGCTEPVPDPLTQTEVNDLRGLLMQMRGTK